MTTGLAKSGIRNCNIVIGAMFLCVLLLDVTGKVSELPKSWEKYYSWKIAIVDLIYCFLVVVCTLLTDVATASLFHTVNSGSVLQKVAFI